MEAIKIINATVAFGVEMAMLVLLAIGGYDIVPSSSVGRWALAVLLPLAVIALWGWLLAPKSEHQLSQPWLCMAQIALFAIAALLAYGSVGDSLIVAFAVLGFGSSTVALLVRQ